MSRIVWLASYPKSGNTWLRLLLRQVRSAAMGPVALNASDDSLIISRRETFERVTGLISSELQRDELDLLRPLVCWAMARQSPDTIYLKVHDRFDSPALGGPDPPADIPQIALYIVRDPRDVCVSFAHHLGLSIEETLTRMVNDRLYLSGGVLPHVDQFPQWLGRWDRHVQSWVDQTSVRLEVLRYEDMLADPVACLDRVLDAIGLAADGDVVRRAIDQCAFSRLAESEQQSGFAERPAQSVRFFRSGKAGGWRNVLTPAQNDRLIAEFGDVMRRYGYLEGRNDEG